MTPVDIGEVTALAEKASAILAEVRAGTHHTDIRRADEALDGRYDQDFVAALLAAPAALLAHIGRQEAEIAGLKERLEITHVWQLIDGELVKVPAPDGVPDGIECRDETIKLLDESRATLLSRLASQAEAIGRVVEAGRPFVLPVGVAPDWPDNKITSCFAFQMREFRALASALSALETASEDTGVKLEGEG